MRKTKPKTVDPGPGAQVACDDEHQAADDEQHDAEVQNQHRVGEHAIER